MKALFAYWQFWALLSAAAAALTAIFAKLGVQGVNSDFATFVRTIVVIVALGALLTLNGSWQSPSGITPRTWIFLTLSGLATGASWLFYFRALSLGQASHVAPIDKLSVVFVAIFAGLFFGENLGLLGWLGVSFIAAAAILVAIA